jgi:hypothetical protein
MLQATAATELIFLTINLAKRKYIGNMVVGGGQQEGLIPHLCQRYMQQHPPEPKEEKIRL